MVYSFLYAPIVILVLFSFNTDSRNVRWTGFTFDWYFKLFENVTLQRALWTSLKVGVISTFLATVLGTLAALALTRYRFKGRSAVTALVFLPMAVPEIVMGTSLLSFFVSLGFGLNFWTVVASHIAFSVGYTTATIRSRLQGDSFVLEEAAADLGATPWESFWLVTFPRITPGIISGAMLSFTLSFDDFVVTFFTAGIGSGTLPLKIYAMVKFGVTPEVNAISTLALLITLLSLLVYQMLQPKEK